MAWEPEQQHLGRLGLAGICLEILRVLLAILPGFDEALFVAVAVLSGCVAVAGDAWRALRLLHAPGEIVLALQLIGGTVCLAGTAYVALVCQLACVVSLLEDASGLGAVRRSRALLAGGMFWRAAAVFAVLDGSFVATLMTFPVAVWDEALGVGRVLQVALCAVVVVVTLVAQPVVYL